MIRRQTTRALLMATLLALSACGSVDESGLLVEVRGSAETVTSSPPEATTSTTPPQDGASEGLPGSDPDGCGAPGPEHTVFLVALTDEEVPVCKVGEHQRLRFFNLTDGDVTVRWAGNNLVVPSDSSKADPTAIGSVIEPGLYRVQASPIEGPQIQLVEKEAGFGAAQIGLRSFGSLRPGQTLSEAEEVLGGSITVQSRADLSTCSSAWVTGDPYSPLISLEGDPIDPTITRVEATAQGQLTFSGIGLGSTVDEARNAYGDNLVTAPITGGIERLTFEPDGSDNQSFRLILDTKQEVVTSLRIGRLGSVENQKPCS